MTAICPPSWGATVHPLLVSLFILAIQEPHEPSIGAKAHNDCGAFALYYLLQGLGARHELAAIEENLGPRAPAGYSMLQLKRAATAMGVPLRGAHVHVGDFPREGPIIALLRLNGHGHYVVIRGVGRSGRSVQILDGFNPPAVVTLTDFMRTREWTGIALVPELPNWPASLAWWGTIASGLSLTGLFCLTQFRRRVGRLRAQSRATDPPV